MREWPLDSSSLKSFTRCIYFSVTVTELLSYFIRVVVKSWQGFPHSSVGKESACNAGDLGSVPELGRTPGEGKGYPLQYSGLKNSMDYSPWGRKELDTTVGLSLSLYAKNKTGKATFY